MFLDGKSVMKLVKEHEQEFLEKINNYLLSAPNPELAKMILFDSWDDGFFLQNASNTLDVPPKEFLENLVYLRENGLVYPDDGGHRLKEDQKRFKKIKSSEGIEDYLRSDMPFGPSTLLDVEGLDRTTTLKAMNSVSDSVDFSYSKQFKFDDLTKLKGLREKSHALLKPIREKEAKYWYEVLGIPKQFFGFPNFVKESDPTWGDHGDIKYFNLRANFQFPHEAFEIGFDQASGAPISSNPWEDHMNEKRRYFPARFKVLRRGEFYNLSLDNIALNTNWGRDIGDKGPFVYRREAEEVMYALKERLEGVLEKS